MAKVEVLVACMHQKDDKLYGEMNLKSDVVLANQCDEYRYDEYVQNDGSVVKLVSSFDRGVGKNRNKALMYATGDYLLFSDEDLVYVDNYIQLIHDAYNTFPDADIIIFDLKYQGKPLRGRKKCTKAKRLHLWNAMRYGAARIVVKKSAVEKYNLGFSYMYGGGARYSCGEDSLFIREAIGKGAKIYLYPETIAMVKDGESTWFKGYNDKYFIDKGVLLANAFPTFWPIAILYFTFGLRNVSKDYGIYDIYKLIRKGCKEYKNI